MESQHEKISRRIKNIRLEKGLTMKDFGELLNTSKGSVNNWEKGVNLPNIRRLNKIAEIGNITLDVLMFGTMNDIIVHIITMASSIENTKNIFTLEEKNKLLKIARLYNLYRSSLGNPYNISSEKEDSSEKTNIREFREENRENRFFNLVLNECNARDLMQFQYEEIVDCILDVLEDLVFDKELNNEIFLTEVSKLMWSLLLNDTLEYYHQSNNKIDKELYDEVYQLLRRTALDIDVLKEKYVDANGNNK